LIRYQKLDELKKSIRQVQIWCGETEPVSSLKTDADAISYDHEP